MVWLVIVVCFGGWVCLVSFVLIAMGYYGCCVVAVIGCLCLLVWWVFAYCGIVVDACFVGCWLRGCGLLVESLWVDCFDLMI